MEAILMSSRERKRLVVMSQVRAGKLSLRDGGTFGSELSPGEAGVGSLSGRKGARGLVAEAASSSSRAEGVFWRVGADGRLASRPFDFSAEFASERARGADERDAARSAAEGAAAAWDLGPGERE